MCYLKRSAIYIIRQVYAPQQIYYTYFLKDYFYLFPQMLYRQVIAFTVSEPFQRANRHESSIKTVYDLHGTEPWLVSLKMLLLTQLFLAVTKVCRLFSVVSPQTPPPVTLAHKRSGLAHSVFLPLPFCSVGVLPSVRIIIFSTISWVYRAAGEPLLFLERIETNVKAY